MRRRDIRRCLEAASKVGLLNEPVTDKVVWKVIQIMVDDVVRPRPPEDAA